MIGQKLNEWLVVVVVVVLAALTVRVGAEVLQSFQNLADSLQSTAEQLQRNNKDLADAIKAAVQKEIEQGNRKNEPLLSEVDLVRAKADSVTGKLREYAQALFDEKYRR